MLYWRSYEHELKELWTCIEGVMKMHWRGYEDLLKGLWTCIEGVMKMYWRGYEDVLKGLWRCFEGVMKMYWRGYEHVLKGLWRCIEGVMNMYWRGFPNDSPVLPHIVYICTVMLALATWNSARYMKLTGLYVYNPFNSGINKETKPIWFVNIIMCVCPIYYCVQEHCYF